MGPEREPRELATHSNYHRLLKKKRVEELEEEEGGRKSQNVLRVPSLIPRAAGPGALAQAGDVGTATRGRHDALGGAARDVVINLGAWRGGKSRERCEDPPLEPTPRSSAQALLSRKPTKCDGPMAGGQ